MVTGLQLAPLAGLFLEYEYLPIDYQEYYQVPTIDKLPKILNLELIIIEA